MYYFDDGGSVSGDTSGIAALPTISSSAQNAFNTAMQNVGTASASQQAVQPFNAAQQGVAGLSNQAMQYSAPMGIGNLPAAQAAAPTAWAPPYSAEEYLANMKMVNDRRPYLRNQANQVYREFVNPTEHYAELARLEAADPTFMEYLPKIHSWQNAVYGHYGETGYPGFEQMVKDYPFLSLPY